MERRLEGEHIRVGKTMVEQVGNRGGWSIGLQLLTSVQDRYVCSSLQEPKNCESPHELCTSCPQPPRRVKVTDCADVWVDSRDEDGIRGRRRRVYTMETGCDGKCPKVLGGSTDDEIASA